MKKKELMKEIYQLKTANKRCNEYLNDVCEKRKRLENHAYGGARKLKMYRELPLRYADTVFYTRKTLLQQEVSTNLQKELCVGAFGEMYLERYNDEVAVLCEECLQTTEGVVFTFSDPYSRIYSLPMNISYEEAISYIGRILYIRITSCKVDEVTFNNKFIQALMRGKHNGLFYKEEDYINNIYKIDIIKDSGFELYGERGKKRDYVPSSFVGYALQHRNVETEEDCIDALTDIQNYARIYQPGLLIKRFSPTELRFVSADGILYSFFFKNGELWFIEELGHHDTLDVLYKKPMELWYAEEHFGKDGKKTEELIDEFRNLPEEQRAGYEEKIRDMILSKRLRYNIDEAVRYAAKEGKRKILPEVQKWRQHKVSYPDWKKIDVLESMMETTNRFVTKSQLRKEHNMLRKRYEELCLFIKDEWYYFKLQLKYLYTTVDERSMVDRVGQLICPLANGWHVFLNRNPEYYSKWRGTFFDEQHRFVSEQIVPYNKKCKGRMFRISDNLLNHNYFTMYGRKSPMENLNNPNDKLREFDEQLGGRLGDDVVCYYVGYCDAVNYDETGAGLHIVDPNTDVLFEGVLVPQEITSMAAGRMCVLGYAYNFFDDKPRFLELQILPYSLTEKLGEYSTDSIVFCNDDVVLVGGRYNSAPRTDFIVL